MAKTKKRTKTPFVGRRKNSNLSRTTKPVIEEATREQAETEMTNEGPKLGLSASATKMKFFGIDLSTEVEKATTQTSDEDSDCYLIVQKSSLMELFAKTACSECGTQGICFKMDAHKLSGFVSNGSLTCPHCEKTLSNEYLCIRLGNSTSIGCPFEINV